MPSQPIQHYGIIDDLYTVVLIGMDGPGGWLCSPHFDSPSVFAVSLDNQTGQKGRRFKITPPATWLANRHRTL